MTYKPKLEIRKKYQKLFDTGHFNGVACKYVAMSASGKLLAAGSDFEAVRRDSLNADFHDEIDEVGEIFFADGNPLSPDE